MLCLRWWFASGDNWYASGIDKDRNDSISSAPILQAGVNWTERVNSNNWFKMVFVEPVSRAVFKKNVIYNKKLLDLIWGH